MSRENNADDDMKSKRRPRFYFGGLANAAAACITQPLELLKVHLQTQQTGKLGLFQMAARCIRNDGVLSLYQGFSASFLRQLTYSTTRFSIYEMIQENMMTGGSEMPFYVKVLAAGISGLAGSVVGVPADLITVRMQNDNKLPPLSRRNYRHVFHGIYMVARYEGPTRLYTGMAMACCRNALMTIGQIAFYEETKSTLVKTSLFADNLILHFISSLLSGLVSALLTQPFDVLKTRMMNAPPRTYAGVLACAKVVAKNGPLGFYKGFLPTYLRLGPYTVITFVLLEQLRLNFGKDPK